MSNTLRQNGVDGQLAEEAAGWFLKLSDPACSETERCNFDAWLAADAAHRAEYQQFERLWKALDSLPKQRSRGMSRAKLAGLALIGALMLLLKLALPVEQQITATGVNEQRHLVLADGTELVIGAASRLRTHYSWLSRTVEVEAGEVQFTVAPDRLRQFEVLAGNGRMRDIGTTFKVANEGGEVTVGVIEGMIEVRLDGEDNGTLIEGGKQLAYNKTCRTAPVPLEKDPAAVWRGGRWTCKDMALGEIVAYLNRQSGQQITLGSQELARLRVSGVFNMSDRIALLEALKALYHLQAIEKNDTTLLIRAVAQ